MYKWLQGFVRKRVAPKTNFGQFVSYPQFSSNTRFLSDQKGSTPERVNDEQEDRIALNDKNEHNIKKENILILPPSQTEDNRIKKLFNLHLGSSNETEDSSTKNGGVYLNILQETVGDIQNATGVEDTIEGLRPHDTEISVHRYEVLKQSLVKSFTRNQLKEYLQNAYKKNNTETSKKKSSNARKDKIASQIITGAWNIKVTKKISTLEDLLVSKSVKLTKPQLFLLLAQNGFLVQYLSRSGVRILFKSEAETIVFTGTEQQVTSAEIVLNHILRRSHSEIINLDAIKRLSNEENNDAYLNKVVRNSEVYFQNIGGDNYELTALNKNQIKRSKRLLLWILDYNKHRRNFLMLPTKLNDTELIPYKDDDSMNWSNREDDFFVMKNKHLTKNQKLESTINRYSQLFASNDDLDYDTSINEVKSLPHNLEHHNKLSAESLEILKDLGVSNSESNDNSYSKESPVKSSSLTDFEEISGFEVKDIEDIHKKLTDFSYRTNLSGIPRDHWNPPIITLTPGNILFASRESNDKAVIPNPPAIKDESTMYRFNSNVPLLHDKVLSLPLEGLDSSSDLQKNLGLVNDPHNYVIQMKFMPSPFCEYEGISFEEKMSYPPVEIWVELNEKSKPDLDTLRVVTVEVDNSYYVSLPGCNSDVKMSCQVSGDLLSFGESAASSENQEDHTDNIEDILNSTTRKYNHYTSQPGIIQFLKESVLDFSGKVTTSIAPTLDLTINGKQLKYNYISMSYRRQLNVLLNGSDSDRLIQFDLVEGGSLGGRKIELNMAGDLYGNIDIEMFKSLLKDSSFLLNGQ